MVEPSKIIFLKQTIVSTNKILLIFPTMHSLCGQMLKTLQTEFLKMSLRAMLRELVELKFSVSIVHAITNEQFMHPLTLKHPTQSLSLNPNSRRNTRSEPCFFHVTADCSSLEDMGTWRITCKVKSFGPLKTLNPKP